MSDQLIEMLKGQLGNDEMIGQLTQQLGEADTAQTRAATEGVLSTLMAGLARNSSTPEGANALGQALERDHDGSVLDNFLGNITGQNQFSNSSALNGAGILGHILGGKQNGAIDMISQMSGLNKGKTGQLMLMLAPMIMGALGKVKKDQGLDSGGLASILTGALTNQKSQGNQTIDIISGFIDSDGDGDMMDDIGRIGKDLLGGFFGR